MISDLSQYQEFIEAKMALAKPCGLRIDRGEIAPVLKPHQADMVEWAVHGGRRALFAAFGLGKTLMQLEICRLIIKHAGGRALIICPLGVKQEFTHDAKELLGFRVQYVRTDPEVAECSEPIMITNYERVRDGAISADGWTVVCLDEASILRGYGTKTYQEFLTLFPGVPYRYVATATPSPNRYKELIHYAGFLGVMDTGQALTRFFQRDSTKANNLTLYPHKEEEFWRWLASWACFVTKPSDLGHDDTGYDLPARTGTGRGSCSATPPPG
jgi:SNF2 family DNA or RNA helicase